MKKVMTALLIVALFALSAYIAIGDPSGADLSTGTSSRYDLTTTGSSAVSAYAGNVTRLDINGTSITQGWQGFFGNILGTIMLGDSGNNTLYDWSLTSPGGEVYASRIQSITWSGVNCTNNTEMANEETALNFTATMQDGINETFTAGAHTTFYIGTNQIDNCPYTTLHNSTGQNSADWEEVLLADGSGNLVYASLVNDNSDGFNGSTFDFQMIVAEDGHSGDTSTTNYYFWAELE